MPTRHRFLFPEFDLSESHPVVFLLDGGTTQGESPGSPKSSSCTLHTKIYPPGALWDPSIIIRDSYISGRARTLQRTYFDETDPGHPNTVGSCEAALR